MTELTVATQEEDLGIIMGSQLYEVVPNKHYLKRGKKKRIGKKKSIIITEQEYSLVLHAVLAFSS